MICDCCYKTEKKRGCFDMKSKLDKPFVHLFRTSEAFYMYDVNTDKIIGLPEEVYYELQKDKTSEGKTPVAKSYLSQLKENGFLKMNRVEEVEHPVTKLLPYYLNHKINQLILQVTQRCNLRCSYCVYSGAYQNRIHTQKRMDKGIAIRAIDYLFAHSKDNDMVYVSFYGGEPLLEMVLIKDCIGYINENYFGKKVNYNLTTNGTLIDEENLSFFVENEIGLTFSLDGPAQIHDFHRKFADNNRGSFDVLISNVKKIKELYPDYYKSHVSFNTVLDTENSFGCINDFILDDSVFQDNMFSASVISDNYTDEETKVSDVFINEKEYEYFKLLLAKIGRIPQKYSSKILNSQFDEMFRKCFGDKRITMSELPRKYHHGGPCIPGTQRLFINAEGKFFPCEKVSEASHIACIGDIDNGIYPEKAETVLNIERFTHDLCENCWAYKNCQICIAGCDDTNSISLKATKKHCVDIKLSIENLFLDYCTLTEVGYSFENERNNYNV